MLRGIVLFLTVLCVSSAGAYVLEPIDQDLLWLYGLYESPQSRQKLEQLVKYEEANWQSNYDILDLFTAPVIYLGERHIDAAGKNFVIENLPKLKELGFTHLALEMFNASEQPSLDEYNQGKLSDEQLREVYQRNWGYDGEAYLAMFKAAVQSGLKLVALDKRDLMPKGMEMVAENQERDEFMAKRVVEIFSENPNAKVLVYAGRLHAHCQLNREGSLRTQIEFIKEKLGIDSQCFSTIVYKEANPLVRAAKKLSPSYGFLPLLRSQYLHDGVFFLEQ